MNTHRLLFLDIDGVLRINDVDSDFYLNKTDTHGYLFNSHCVENLKTLIYKFPDIKIVIISDWKVNLTFNQMLTMWHMRDMPGMLHDIAGERKYHVKSFDRESSILNYLVSYKEANLKNLEYKTKLGEIKFAVLEDAWFPQILTRNYVMCDPDRGFGKYELNKTIKLFL